MAVVLVIIVAGAVGGFLFYGPSNVSLRIKDPPPQAYDSSIASIVVSFSKIEVHAANAGNDSGWHTIVTNGSVNLLTVLNVSKVLGTASIPAGRYTEIRFFASTAAITIAGIVVTYTIASGGTTGLKVPITGGGFQVMGGLSASVQLDFAFKNSEIMANGMLTPVVTATVA